VGLVGLDAILGRTNDYYLATLVVPVDGPTAGVPPEIAQLADTLFGRVATWYAAA